MWLKKGCFAKTCGPKVLRFLPTPLCILTYRCPGSRNKMAVSLGKRKREINGHESDGSNEDEGALRSLFQRAFEAKFKPLERASPVIEPAAEEEDEQSDSDWQGLSGDEQDDLIETFHHESSHNIDNEAQLPERKAFMVCPCLTVYSKHSTNGTADIQTTVVGIEKQDYSNTNYSNLRRRPDGNDQPQTRSGPPTSLKGVASPRIQRIQHQNSRSIWEKPP